jgi:hypothetical protein
MIGTWRQSEESRLYESRFFQGGTRKRSDPRKGFNVSESNSQAIGGLIVVNDVRASVEAYIDDASITANDGDIEVTALENATIKATTDGTIHSSGGSALGEGKSVAIGGVIATNLVQSLARAYVQNSPNTLTARDADDADSFDFGNIRIEADNTSVLDATTKGAISSGDKAIGVVLAFNSVGWKSQNVLFNAIDALIGDPAISEAFDGDGNGAVEAFIKDARIVADGDLLVDANASSTITATLSNDATSAASALKGAEGSAVGVVLSSNKVNSSATAYIDNSGLAPSLDPDIHVSGKVDVIAADTAEITANSSLKAISTVTNDFGASAIADFADSLINNYQYTTESGERYVDPGEKVRVGESHTGGGRAGSIFSYEGPGVDFMHTDSGVDVAVGQIVEVDNGDRYRKIGSALTDANLAEDAQNYTTSPLAWELVAKLNLSNDSINFNSSDWTELNPVDYSSDEGVPWTCLVVFPRSISYRRSFSISLRRPISLSTICRSTISPVTSGDIVKLANGTRYEYSGSDFDGVFRRRSRRFGVQNYENSSDWTRLQTPSGTIVRVAAGHSAGGTVGSDYRYVGEDETGINLSAENYSNTDRWVEVTGAIDSILNSAIIDELNLNATESNSSAVGALFVVNDVRSDVIANIDFSDMDADGGVQVKATESATITATIASTVTSDGGSFFKDSGTSRAINGVVATNAVISAADASISNSDVTTLGEAGIVIDADNTSTITAEVESNTKSNGTSVGVTLAFNSIGWNSQNFLFNTIDALLGTDIGNPNPATVNASIFNSTVNSAGAIEISADSKATIDALIKTGTTSIKAGTGESKAISVGAIIAMNKINTDVNAFIDASSSVIAANGNIDLDAGDDSSIQADVSAPSLSVSVGKKAMSVSVGVAIARNEIANKVDAFIRDTDLVEAQDGSVFLTANQMADIDAVASASSISVAVSASQGAKSFSGGGAIATNVISGNVNAFISGSTVTASGTDVGDGNVILDTDNLSTIDATIRALSVSVAASTGEATSASIGLSIARNFIGFDEGFDYTSDSFASPAFDFTSNENVDEIVQGDLVRLTDDHDPDRDGEVYQYSGSGHQRTRRPVLADLRPGKRLDPDQEPADPQCRRRRAPRERLREWRRRRSPLPLPRG